MLLCDTDLLDVPEPDSHCRDGHRASVHHRSLIRPPAVAANGMERADVDLVHTSRPEPTDHSSAIVCTDLERLCMACVNDVDVCTCIVQQTVVIFVCK